MQRRDIGRFCGCGCGEWTNPRNYFIVGHNNRGKIVSIETREKMSRNTGKRKKRKKISLLCECGCGKSAKPGDRFIHGHNGRGKVGWSKGLTKETDKRIARSSVNSRGQIAWNKGRKATEEERKKNSMVIKKYLRDNPDRLKSFIEEAKKRSQDPKIKDKISKSVTELWQDSKYRKKLRLSHMERIRRQDHHPSYNETSCIFFKQFDEDFGTQGQYATNGGEYYVKELGYWVDYINFELKLIMEWDEREHYNAEGSLKERDVRRQREIQDHFLDFLFVRIREEEFLGKGMRLVDFVNLTA